MFPNCDIPEQHPNLSDITYFPISDLLILACNLMLAIFAIGHWSYLQISSELRGRTLILPACAAFSCFADLALTSPEDYKLEGQGSLMQCVLTPADKFMPLTNEQICEQVDAEVTFQASFLPV